MTPIDLTERRLSAGAIGLAVLVFLAVLAGTPASYPSFDEAKYLGIGFQVLAGNGPRTVFGVLFLPHAPVWPLMVDFPAQVLGVDPLSVGHFLDALFGAALLLLIGAFGWRVRPVVGAVSVAAYAAFPYFFELTRTARLDTPAAALALAYVFVGWTAVRRGSYRWGLLAGALFAWAFLVKEIALPFAPLPFLLGLWERVRLGSLLRALSGTVATAAIGTSWWFLMVAQYTHRVYRLGTPAWTLLPLAALALVVSLAGPLLERYLRGRRSAARARGWRDPRLWAWLLTVVWCLVLTGYFQAQGTLAGAGLFAGGQYRLYLNTWLPATALRAGAVFLLLGGILAVAGRVRDARLGVRTDGPGIEVLALLLVGSLPLVLLVIAVGEPPRNYLAQLGLFAALATAGWVGVIEAGIVRWGFQGPRQSRATVRPPLPRAVIAVGLAVALVAGLGTLGGYALTHRVSPGGRARATTVNAVVGWLMGHALAGERVGFGSLLAYETSLHLPATWHLRQLAQTFVVGDPQVTSGFRYPTSSGVPDLLAIDAAPRRSTEYYAFLADAFTSRVIDDQLTYYVYFTGTTTSVPSLLGALTPDHGFTPLATWHTPLDSSKPGGAYYAATIFRVDRAHVSFAGSAIFLTPEALARVDDLFGGAGSVGQRAAAALLARLAVSPDDARVPPLLDRLQSIAGK